MQIIEFYYIFLLYHYETWNAEFSAEIQL